MTSEAAILVIDRDAELLCYAEGALRGLGRVQLAASAEQATAALRESNHYSIILTALSFPDMENGLMLPWMRELHPTSVRLLMTRNEGVRTVADAINDAAPFRVLVKPFTREALRRSVIDAQVEYDRLVNERQMLEGTLHGSLEAIAGMLAVVHPAAFGRAARVRRMVTMLADKIGLPDRWDMQIAALLSQFSALGLDADLVERLCRQGSMTPEERTRVNAAVEATLTLVAPIPRMARVCEILRSIELVPGGAAGLASRWPGDAERVLAIALDFDSLFSEHASAAEALHIMESRSGRYHVPYLTALRELVGDRNAARFVELPLADVRIGHVFATDVRAPNNLLFIARGQPVTPPLLLKIRCAWEGFAAHTIVRVIEAPEPQP